MRRAYYILTIIFLTVACTNGIPDKINRNDTFVTDINSDSTSNTYNVYKNDSVSIDVTNDNFRFFILLTIGNLKREYDLEKLNILTKTPDEILWANKEYACMMTWWSQAESRYVFIPNNQTNQLIYIDKDIEATDSINNNIVYVDSLSREKDEVIFKAENLMTRKSKTITIKIDRDNSIYPFYDEIILTKEKLTIKTPIEQKKIDIKEINE